MRAGWIVVWCVLAAGALSAQSRREVELLRTADGRVLDYPTDGVWRTRARAVRRQVATRIMTPAGAELSAPAPAVAGTLRFPTLLLSFSNQDTIALPRSILYDSLYYGPTPLAGRTYSLRTFYQEQSDGRLNIEGIVAPWSRFDSTNTWLFASCGGAPTDCPDGRARMRMVFVDALSKLDATVDFGQFDNDGPDGIPNSGDDDGVADVVQFVQPQLGAECFGSAIGAHKWSLSSLGGAFVTNDAAASGGSILVDAYHIVSGVGGAGTSQNSAGCGFSTVVSGIGTAAHELGHGFGLPDLYDVSGSSAGIGEWGLMGSGGYTSANSPTYLSAWSRAELGWVAVLPVSEGAHQLSPVETHDTVLLVRPHLANPRGEYFLLEDRQALRADTANMLYGGLAGPKNGGLLIWHVDSVKLAEARATNTINAGSIHGLRLEQADGLHQLDAVGGNRGDAGDPWPGTAGHARWSYNTSPASHLSDGTNTYISLDSIAPVAPGGSLRLVYSTGIPSIVRAPGSFSVDGVSYQKYVLLFLTPGTVHTVDVDSVQVAGGVRFTWERWSDGLSRSHSFVATNDGDTLIATMSREFRIEVTIEGSGHVETSAGDTVMPDTFYPPDTTLALVAVPDSGWVFELWFNGPFQDFTRTRTVVMSGPAHLNVRFLPELTAGNPSQAAVMGAPVDLTLPVAGGSGTYEWSFAYGAMPPGLVLLPEGRIAGVPESTGTWTAVFGVASGRQTRSVTVAFYVSPPEVVVEDVVAEILGYETGLTADVVRYFDLLGNRNGHLDIGDFLAWVRATGGKPPPD